MIDKREEPSFQRTFREFVAGTKYEDLAQNPLDSSKTELREKLTTTVEKLFNMVTNESEFQSLRLVLRLFSKKEANLALLIFEHTFAPDSQLSQSRDVVSGLVLYDDYFSTLMPRAGEVLEQHENATYDSDEDYQKGITSDLKTEVFGERGYKITHVKEVRGFPPIDYSNQVKLELNYLFDQLKDSSNLSDTQQTTLRINKLIHNLRNLRGTLKETTFKEVIRELSNFAQMISKKLTDLKSASAYSESLENQLKGSAHVLNLILTKNDLFEQEGSSVIRDAYQEIEKIIDRLSSQKKNAS